MHRWHAIAIAVAVFGLSVIGLVMLASTSYYLEEAGGENYYTLRQHTMWLGVSFAACVFGAMVDYRVFYRWRWWIFGLTILTLALCFTHEFGESVNGAARWISLKAVGLRAVHFQPSEFAKLSCAIALAAWFARQEPLTREFGVGFLKPGIMVASMALLIGAEVDLGSAALVVAVGGGMMFVAGTRLLFLAPVFLCTLGGFAFVVKMMPNRVERVLAFLDLEKYKEGLGLQQWRSLLAFGSGGVHGLGLGNGRQKMNYLPEAHTDFIFPMVGEEFGLVGTTIVVGLFVLLIAGGLMVAHRAEDRFGKLLAFGIVLMLGLEALMNMGVTTALLPNKGLPLPFVSYGGSSLVAAMLGVGILLNIHHQSSAAGQMYAPLTRRRRPFAQAA
jgi:cell division protein FtsW